MIEKPPVERDMDMAEVGEASGAAVQRSEKTARVFLANASGKWKQNKKGNRLRNETSEAVSVTGDWSSPTERTVRQQWREVTLQHETIDRMTRILEAHAACEGAQWLGMK
jgi:hypothetical protein